ncbi:MAG: hypothetical protein AAB425_07585, partial [Bdellovibrionota bacterium]
MLNRILAVENGQNLIRVYPSRRLVIASSTKIGSDIEVDEEVNLELNGKIRKDTLKRKAAGKILSVENLTVKDGVKVNFTRLYISFDQSCTTVECAFVFENPLVREWHNYSYYFKRTSGSFQLSSIPSAGPFSQIDAMWLGRKPVFFRKMEVVPSGYYSYNILDTVSGKAANLMLEIDVDE